MAVAREKLEITLADVQMEKIINNKYNENEFLDEFILSKLKNTEIKGDTAVVDGFAFELDRSVPKIGHYLGLYKDLVFPEVDATVQLATDNKNATINITASEKKNGINKIEIWFLGAKIKEYEYNPMQNDVTLEPPYTATQNGKYTIKAYGDLMVSKAVTVSGIVPAVVFLPNGNTEWKRQHATKITVKETSEKITSMKYLWTTNSSNEPDSSEFTQECTNDSTIIGGNDKMTGKYYLWILLTTESGKTNICRSEVFNFDNEKPTVTLKSEPVSETSFSLTAIASDTHSGIVQYEFYVEDELVDIQKKSERNATYVGIIDEMNDNLHCYVIVRDTAENCGQATVTARTLLYAWEEYSYGYRLEDTYSFNVNKNGSWSLGPSSASTPSSTIYSADAGKGCYFFEDTPIIIFEFNSVTGETELLSTNGTYKNLTTYGSIRKEYLSGGWKYVVMAKMDPYSNFYAWRNFGLVSDKISAYRTDYVKTTKTFYDKTTSKENILLSKNKDEWPEDGYKDGRYTVKVGMR